MRYLLILGLTFVAAWLTHIITCIQDERFLLLLAGAIMFPIGIIHGFGKWFGFF